tara:strand:+ start:740 stop:1486 length:747 start_codon:yes stop_codon:yes gene_type:complete
LFKLNNKVALVTGASRGIGKEIAKVISQAGAHVVCLARSEKKIKELSDSINNNNGSASYYCCDINDSKKFSEIIKSIVTKLGSLDILINNAGITRDSLLLRLSEENWDIVLDTNLKATFQSIKASLRPMFKNKFGRIINITSIVGLTGNQGQANYAASKSGLIGMSKSIAKEVASRGITINCIAPGWIETEMTNEISKDSKEDLIKKIPIGKIGEPKDIAYTVLFLASEEAKYITGQTITVDGGRIIN